MAADPSPFAVEALGIRKSFAGVPALRDCSLRVRRGETHALLGQNGAGKSTLVKILNGVHPVGTFEGQVWLRGQAVQFHSPAQARKSGVGYVPQEIEVIEHLSIAENIFVGVTGLDAGPFVNWKLLHRRAQMLLDELDLCLVATTPTVTLTAAQRHLVMIARALVARPAVLILDEPTASLSSSEIERLFTVLRTLKAHGTTLVYITHRLSEVLALSDRASVLRDGVMAAEFERQDFDIARLVASMAGVKVELRFPRHRPPVESPPILTLEHFSVTHQGRDRVRDVSFELRRGEILGVAGLLGAGRTELLSAIYGDLPHRGRVWVNRQERALRSTRHAQQAGIALLTEDRKRDGLLFNLPLGANITVGHLGALSRAGIIRPAKERQTVLLKMQELKMQTASPEAAVAHLSGGTQQKLLFARALLRCPQILLLDEPSKGVDVATRHAIYRLIVDLANRGVGVILVSSELEEVLGLADRVLVMAEGRIVDSFSPEEGNEERIARSVSAAQSWRAQVNLRQ